MYMHIAYDQDKEAFIAVITDKLPSAMQPDETITVLSVGLFPTKAECSKWFDRMRRERPWEPMNA